MLRTPCAEYRTSPRDSSGAYSFIWGNYDLCFDPGEPERYRKDAPKAGLHILDAVHFALDTTGDEIAVLVREIVK